MARSHAIWLLTYKTCIEPPMWPVAAFTVKHEMKTYLDRNRWQWDELRLYKMIDSPHPVPAYREEPSVTELDIREVMM